MEGAAAAAEGFGDALALIQELLFGGFEFPDITLEDLGELLKGFLESAVESLPWVAAAKVLWGVGEFLFDCAADAAKAAYEFGKFLLETLLAKLGGKLLGPLSKLLGGLKAGGAGVGVGPLLGGLPPVGRGGSMRDDFERWKKSQKRQGRRGGTRTNRDGTDQDTTEQKDQIDAAAADGARERRRSTNDEEDGTGGNSVDPRKKEKSAQNLREELKQQEGRQD